MKFRTSSIGAALLLVLAGPALSNLFRKWVSLGPDSQQAFDPDHAENAPAVLPQRPGRSGNLELDAAHSLPSRRSDLGG